MSKKDFINGVVAPDLENDKFMSHYENYGTSHIGLKNFIGKSENYIKTDFGKGYLLHLITDEAFYHYYFAKETKYILTNKLNFYYDYGTNKYIMRYFENEYIPKDAIDFIKIRDDNPKILNINKISEFINKLSSKALKDQVENIKIKNEILL